MNNKKDNLKILVTGGAGFIGSHLVDALIDKGHRVSVVDDLSGGDKKNVNLRAKLYIEKIQGDKIAQIFDREQPEVVFHLAAQLDNQFSAKHPVVDADINVLGSLNILKNCVDSGVKKIVFFSSAAVYGNTKKFPTTENDPVDPIYPYGIAKLSVERYIQFFHQIHGLEYTIFRPSNAYGPRQKVKGEGGVIAIFAKNMIQNKPAYINGTGKQTRDFIYVDDIVSACVKSLKLKKSKIYNISTQKETDINYIFDKINKLAGSETDKVSAPAPDGEQYRSVLKNLRAKRELKWKPKIKIDEGLEKTVNWFRENL